MTTPDAPPLSPGLAIEPRHDPRGVILVLRGEIDIASASHLEDAVVEALATEPASIAIDLAGVEFIDSTGLRTLMGAQARAAAKGHSLILRHARRQARRLFELTGIANAFVTDWDVGPGARPA